MDAVENSQIPQPIESIQQVPIEPKKKYNTLLIVILLIAILLVGVGGVYAGMQIVKKQTPVVVIPTAPPQEVRPTDTFPTSVPDETANWKTYTNEKYGFEFKYPTDWKNEEDSSTKNLIVALDPQKVSLKESLQQGLDNIYGLVVIRASSDENSAIVGWNTFKKETIGVDKIKVRTSEERTNSNVPNPSVANKHIINYYLEDKGITFEYVSDLSDNYLTQFNQILSTFKFTANGENCIAEGGKGNYTSGPRCCQSLVATDCSPSSDPPCAAMESTCFTCIKCGDGKCGKGETKCNCPSDCN